MPDAPVSPAAARLATPSWLDGRLVLGALLVLVSIVVGARVLSSADASQGVWVATRPLAAGSTLADGDLAPGRVRLFDNGARYLGATGSKPVGYVLQRGVGAQELLPRDSLTRPDDLARRVRDVSVPVGAGHLPDDLQSGQQVDVYVTPGSTTRAPGQPIAAGGTRLVLSRITVTLRPRGGGGLGASGTAGVVLSVPDTDAATLVAAVQEGAVDLVRVPNGDNLPGLGAAATPPARAAG